MIFRNRNLGTISSLNEYIAFREEHGIADKSYNDLYLGDYFTIQDGTYNAEWIVAHFDYYYDIGLPGETGPRGVLLINSSNHPKSKMNNSEASTAGGYNMSVANTITCPAIASALERVLGSYLIPTGKMITDAVSINIPSMAGAGRTGASSSRKWINDRCIIPNEVQMYGANVASSSFCDTGEAYNKLALFNAAMPTRILHRSICWLRSVSSSDTFCYLSSNGYSNTQLANTEYDITPLIYIG